MAPAEDIFKSVYNEKSVFGFIFFRYQHCSLLHNSKLCRLQTVDCRAAIFFFYDSHNQKDPKYRQTTFWNWQDLGYFVIIVSFIIFVELDYKIV